MRRAAAGRSTGHGFLPDLPGRLTPVWEALQRPFRLALQHDPGRDGAGPAQHGNAEGSDRHVVLFDGLDPLFGRQAPTAAAEHLETDAQDHEAPRDLERGDTDLESEENARPEQGERGHGR